jgi:hypothetical protein
MVDERLRAAYESTEYWVDESPVGPFRLRHGERSEPLDRLLARAAVREWAYVTACNPRSRRLPDEENEDRMRALDERLRRMGLVHYPGRGVGTGGDWPAEASRLVLDVTEVQARELAAEFGQNAIVAGAAGEAGRVVVLD